MGGRPRSDDGGGGVNGWDTHLPAPCRRATLLLLSGGKEKVEEAPLANGERDRPPSTQGRPQIGMNGTSRGKEEDASGCRLDGVIEGDVSVLMSCVGCRCEDKAW